MIEEEDTSPLRTRADVPPEMLRVLRALKTEGPSRGSLNQVAARLGDLLDAAPPAPPAGHWLLRSVGARVVALRVGMAVLAIGATAVWLRPSAPERDPAHALAGGESDHDQLDATGDSTRGARGVSDEGAQGSASGQPAFGVATAARTSGSTNDGESGHVQHDGSSGRAHRMRSRSTRGGAPATAVLSAQTGLARTRSADGDTASALVAEQRAESVADKPDAAVPPASAAPAEPASARKLNEVELLLDARRLSVRDPKAAQRLLEQHAARFPNGVLAPEREVLAIEVLKALGQTAAAEQRLRAFRARYPNSMHLRRLSSPPANQDR